MAEQLHSQDLTNAEARQKASGEMRGTKKNRDRSPCLTFRWIGVTVGPAIVGILASGFINVLAAQGGMKPMAGMDTAARRKHPDMRGMMAAPLPFGIMIGQAEQWMAGYQYMLEKFDGLLEGTHAISNANVLGRFDTTPTDMTMQTHMAMIMYAPSNRSTVMAMLPYVQMSMGELHRDGTRSTERSTGIGDVELRALYSLYEAKAIRHRFLATFGVGLPTGSVNQLDAEGVRTEYPMQTGSERTRCSRASCIAARRCRGAGEQS
jgi:hypothetical protein